MLPDIVRAAAEPMGNIDNLTVLSNDGASDVVKNVTRTVTEAGTTVKGLTGIDIPQMLSQAMGGAVDGGATGRSGSGGSGGGARARSTGARGGGRSTAPATGTAQAGSGATGPGARSAPGAESAPAAEPTPPVQSRPAGTSSRPAPASVDLTTPTPPRFESQAQIDSALEQADQAIRAAAASTLRTDTAVGPARPARTSSPARPARPPSPASAAITRETTVDEAAQRLATDLRAIPGIERFAAVRLAELERSGPRPLRTMWRIAREHLDAQYGQLTIGELLEMYGPDRTA
jgi:flotillin